MEDYIKFNKARATARRIINLKKKQSFIAFTQNINRFSNMSYVWNKVLKHACKQVEWNK